MRAWGRAQRVKQTLPLGGRGGAALIGREPTLAPPEPVLSDVVFFTQRGTSKAEPSLQCPDYNAVMLFAAVAGASTEERRADQRATFWACVDGFRDQGVDFSAHHTDENADDVADIVTALGYDKVIYEGASYGTWLGQVLAKRSGGRGADRRRAPAAQRLGLRRTAHQQA